LDKKMRRLVTKPIRKAEKILKKAERSNMKLANYDEKVRDPLIERAERMKKHFDGKRK
jgi:hypothetical protein